MGKSWGPKTNVRVNNRDSAFPEEFWDDPNEITQSLEKYEDPVEVVGETEEPEAKPKNTLSNILLIVGLILVGIALIGAGIALMSPA